jgi:IclR family transcriptional regulator, KDG regulon repressor
MNNTLANGLQLLAFLAGTAESYSVTEIAQRLDLPKSHVHRLLQTLVEQGYAEQDEDRRYRVGLQPLVVSSALLHNHPLRIAARPLLHELAQTLDMDALLAIPNRGSAVVLAAVYPAGRQRDPGTAIGGRLVFPSTATARLYACTIDGFADASELPTKERTRIAREHFALKDPDLVHDYNGMSCAITDADGNVVASLGCSAPREHFNANLSTARDALQRAAATLTATFAHRPTA